MAVAPFQKPFGDARRRQLRLDPLDLSLCRRGDGSGIQKFRLRLRRSPANVSGSNAASVSVFSSSTTGGGAWRGGLTGGSGPNRADSNTQQREFVEELRLRVAVSSRKWRSTSVHFDVERLASLIDFRTSESLASN